MPISPEQAQYLTHLQQKILTNIQEGKPSSEGITKEDIAQGLDFLRSNRQVTLEGEGAKPRKAGGKASKPLVQIDTKTFTDVDLD